MTVATFLDSINDRLEDVIERVQVLSHDLDERELNRRPDPKHWSMGQIFEHMVMGVEGYLPSMRSAVQEALRQGVDRDVSHTWFGRMIIKASGPGSNTPVPKALIPSEGPHQLKLVE